MSQNNKETLTHHGIPGMKWGVRRYQNKDGSLTAAGRKKVAKMKDEYTALTGKRLIRKSTSSSNKSSNQNNQDDDDKKNVKDMSTAELRAKTDRLTAEKNYIDAVNNRKSVEPQQVSKGKVFVDKILKDVVEPAATDVAKQVVKSYLVKMTNDGLKLDEELKVYTNNKKK